MVHFWVIDASVIGVANNVDHSQCANANEFLNRLRRLPSRIVMSYEIRAEYERRYRESPKGLGTKWWHSIKDSDKFEFRYERVPSSIRRELRRRRFHDDDDKYVAVALAVSDRNMSEPIVCIVQEDKEDFGLIEDLLTGEGIQLANIEEAIQLIETEEGHA